MNAADRLEYVNTIARRRHQLGINFYSDPPKHTTTNPQYRHDDPHYCQNAEAGIYEPSRVVPAGNDLPRDIENPPRGLIRLHPDDVDEALRGARRLRKDAHRIGARERFGCPPEEGQNKQNIGALGEVALARAFGAQWHHQSGTFGRTPDVEGWQVRTRSTLSDLCIQHTVKDLRGAFMLIQVVHWPYLLNIAGWMWGVDAHQDPWLGFKAGGEKVYYVPAGMLHDKHFLLPSRTPELEGQPRDTAAPKYPLNVLEDS